jgi:nicotinamide-nucleotide amidase
MKVSLLVIGNEILNGKITDANTRFLAEYLMTHHFDFHSVLTVRDIEEDIHRGLESLFAHSEIIITSGGLGPTKDDITKGAIARYLKREIVYNGDAEEVAKKSYTRLNRVWPGSEHEYAKLPVGFIPLTNSIGFAPSFFIEEKRGIILSAPGVPREFKAIIEDHLTKITSHRRKTLEYYEYVTVRTQKVPEEKIFNEVDPELWDALSVYGDVSSLPVFLGVDICVKIVSSSKAETENKKQKVLDILRRSPVHQHVWHYGPESLEEVILQKAREKKITFGFAESATGGLCSHRVTGVAGSSACFMGSVICYDESVKIKTLGVSAETISQKGVVSFETASEMAQGLKEKLSLDIAISITGIAGPGGGSAENPVGTVWIGTSTRIKNTAEQYKLFGDREQLKSRFAQLALLKLLSEVENFA